MPEGRPYSLGNTSADQASINATSEMSASGRACVRAAASSKIRAPCPMRTDDRYTAPATSRPVSAYARSIRAARANCWPGAGFIEAQVTIEASPAYRAILPQERDQRRVDLVGAFLLDPVAGAVDDEFLLQVRQNPLDVGDALARRSGR